jgi:hypothetical protein
MFDAKQHITKIIKIKIFNFLEKKFPNFFKFISLIQIIYYIYHMLANCLHIWTTLQMWMNVW